MKSWPFLNKVAHNPIQSIAVIVALGLVAYGVILVGATLLGALPHTPGLAFSSDLNRVVFGTIITIIGMLYPLSVTKYQIKILPHPGMWMFGAYAFLTIIRLETVGFFPIVWLFSAVLALVSGVIYFWDKKET